MWSVNPFSENVHNQRSKSWICTQLQKYLPIQPLAVTLLPQNMMVRDEKMIFHRSVLVSVIKIQQLTIPRICGMSSDLNGVQLHIVNINFFHSVWPPEKSHNLKG